MSTPSFQLSSKPASVTPNLRKCENLSIQEILIVTWTYFCPSVFTTGQPMWNFTLSSQCGSLHPDIAHPWYDSCQNMVLADQSHKTILQAQVQPIKMTLFFLSYPLTNFFCQFLTDCWLNSKWKFFVMVISLLFEVNYKFINKSFAFSLAKSIYY